MSESVGQAEDRLTPAEPVSTAGQPLPALRRPFASFSQMPRSELGLGYAAATPSEPPPSAPPSIRRPLSAGPQRKLGTCQIHKVALSPKGECVLCKREAESLMKTRWSLAATLIVLAVAILAGIVLAR
jgi:hypothetical protein